MVSGRDDARFLGVTPRDRIGPDAAAKPFGVDRSLERACPFSAEPDDIACSGVLGNEVDLEDFPTSQPSAPGADWANWHRFPCSFPEYQAIRRPRRVRGRQRPQPRKDYEVKSAAYAGASGSGGNLCVAANWARCAGPRSESGPGLISLLPLWLTDPILPCGYFQPSQNDGYVIKASIDTVLVAALTALIQERTTMRTSKVWRWVIGASIGFTPAFSLAEDQSLVGRMAACATIEAAEPRLACFDAITRQEQTVPPAPPPAAQTPAPTESAAAGTPSSGEPIRNAEGQVIIAGDWIVLRETDSLTDHPKVSLIASGSLEVGDSNRTPSLHIRCFERGLEIFVIFNQYLNSSQGIPIRFRFDQQPAVSQTWSPSTSGTGAFSNDPRGFVDRISRAERLIVEASDFRGQRYRAAFNLRGAQHVLPDIATCRSPPPASQNRRRR